MLFSCQKLTKRPFLKAKRHFYRHFCTLKSILSQKRKGGCVKRNKFYDERAYSP